MLGLLVAAALAWSGCGGEDQCADVDCDFGQCDSQTGECVNPDECTKDRECLPGYECSDEDYTCQGLNECSTDEDCEKGVCINGVCETPPSYTCESNDDCLERTFCGPDDVCEPDPCNDFSCARGTCKRGTQECVSEETCTPETEHLDCVEGDVCFESSCVAEEDFCDLLECHRGVCDVDARGCVNADDCGGDDTLCKEGYFCDDQDECRENLCDEPCIHGVCDPDTGECVEPTEPCESHNDCLSDRICVGGSCLPASHPCGNDDGDGGCPGNQICEVDLDEGTAECLEPEDECTTSFDCFGDRQCGGLGGCFEPLPCGDDAFEPNDDAAAAVDFGQAADDHTLAASLCPGDTDAFSFESGDIGNPGERGVLVVELDVNERDMGLGKLEMSLVDEEGNELTADTGVASADGGARIEKTLAIPDHGAHVVEITSSDGVKVPGVDYELSVNVVPEETLEACEQAPKMRVNQRVSGETDFGQSSYLGSSCTGHPNDTHEMVYELELDTPQQIFADLAPKLSSTDLSLALRESCISPASERACADDRGEGEVESIAAVLDEGTYYLIVEAGEDAAGGAFELTVDSVYTTCAPKSDYCADASTAMQCQSSGGAFETVECDGVCDPTSGHCTASGE